MLFVHLKASWYVSLHLMYFVSSVVATLKPFLHVELGEEAQIFFDSVSYAREGLIFAIFYFSDKLSYSKSFKVTFCVCSRGIYKCGMPM